VSPTTITHSPRGPRPRKPVGLVELRLDFLQDAGSREEGSGEEGRSLRAAHLKGCSTGSVSLRRSPASGPCRPTAPRPPKTTTTPPPTPPRGRTWAPVCPTTTHEGTQLAAASTHTPPRPGTRPTWHLGRALLGARSRLIHLAPPCDVGREGEARQTGPKTPDSGTAPTPPPRATSTARQGRHEPTDPRNRGRAPADGEERQRTHPPRRTPAEGREGPAERAARPDDRPEDTADRGAHDHVCSRGASSLCPFLLPSRPPAGRWVGMFAVSWRPGELTENRERSFSADVRDALLRFPRLDGTRPRTHDTVASCR
jgi:hypothetical protein